MPSHIDILQEAFAAIEHNDDNKLTSLIEARDGSYDKYRMLTDMLVRYCGGGDLPVVRKLLDFPSFDPSSPDYIRAVSGVYIYQTVNKADGRIDTKLLDALYERISAYPETKAGCLRFVFDTAAQHGLERINIYGAKLLADGGADCDAAAKDAEADQRSRLTHAQERLTALTTLKTKLKGI